MIYLVLILALVVILVSPVGGFVSQAIVKNKELAVTVGVLLIFKLLQHRIDGIRDSISVEKRTNYALLTMLLVGLLLIFARSGTWWGFQVPSNLVLVMGIGLVFYPLFKGKRKAQTIFNEKFGEIEDEE